ncbi:MAG: ABC transporter [Marinilabiliales bacterium]|nr:MAG: ABC transporter [Marinilabiliales bacterium]
MVKKGKIKPSGELLNPGNISCRHKDGTLFINGSILASGTGTFYRAIGKEIPALKGKVRTINLDGITDIDSAGVTALYHVRRLLGSEGDITIETEKASIKKKLDLFSPSGLKQASPPPEGSLAERIGEKAHWLFTSYLYGFINLAANIFYWSVSDIFKRRTFREGEFINQSVKIGVNASMIIVFMSFAIGLVLAVHSGSQLSTFGANIYIVDLTVIAVMSQMGPLITAILVAGRSSSSIAAEIATMKVTSELDALNTMGLDPVRFVVVPKLYACLFTMPFLIILANVSGIAGGATAAYLTLDITPEIFINRMGRIMQNKDLLTGFVKSQVYAALIVLTGSFYGFSVERGAEGVGRVTTLAVVVSISLVILADSVMGLLFY